MKQVLVPLHMLFWSNTGVKCMQKCYPSKITRTNSCPKSTSKLIQQCPLAAAFKVAFPSVFIRRRGILKLITKWQYHDYCYCYCFLPINQKSKVVPKKGRYLWHGSKPICFVVRRFHLASFDRADQKTRWQTILHGDLASPWSHLQWGASESRSDTNHGKAPNK